ncbi:MAG: DUF1295 domain-containing protein [Lewinellaceae bacterium]|nr:DUF1295 domain-containing protein [Saprospiraceae bacterium]MCB9342606.1 DUF1295 domain-containing protein [Lewinellaceae bacterium]
MLKTILLLLIALLILPAVAIYFDDPLSSLQLVMLTRVTIFMLSVAAICFITGELSGNYSQVDKIWSIMPILYTGYFAWASDWNSRITLMAVIAAIWGIRLTYNFSRRGAYTWKFWAGEEDYRWKILREQPMFNSKWKWTAFNLFFICLYQNSLILLFTLPALMASGSEKPLGPADWVLAIICITAIYIEWLADQQQWDFQQEKHRRIDANQNNKKLYSDGFVSTGLWRYVRHPNYTAEQAIWVFFYAFTIAATGKWLNWSAAGCILLLLLFQGSADFSEKISASKYTGYSDYQKRTGKFLPTWK